MVRTGLVSDLTSYVGRRSESADVRRLLGSARLVTLTGPGGVGKTRLAFRIAADAARAFRDGVYFVELAEIRGHEHLVATVADRIDLQLRSGQPAIDRVLEYLRDREVLLVLDNCEHVLGASAESVAALLTHCAKVTVLATSRQSLGVPGERTFRVPPLAVPPGTPAPSELMRYDSSRLFAERAAAQTDFDITPRNAADVARLCRRLEGVPLAIELAAARMRSLPLRQICERLDHSLTLLTTGSPVSPERHRTLRATIEWSYELCSRAERLVWSRASVFAGSFDLGAAEFVCGGDGVEPAAVLDVIDGLVHKSVLERDGTEDARYRMLETIREFGQDELRAAADDTRIARRHRDWFDRLSARADAEWIGPAQSSWVWRLRRDHANLRAALEWSLTEPGEAANALPTALRIVEYWTLRGANREARDRLDRALAATAPDHPDRARGLVTSAQYSVWLSDIDGTETRLDEAEQIAARRGDEPVAAFADVVRAQVAKIRLEDELSAELAAATVPVFRAHGDARNELRALLHHGIANTAGSPATGLRILRDMTQRCAELDETYYRDMALFGIAMIEVMSGRPDAAESAARQALASTRLRDSRFGDAYHLETLAWCAAGRGEFERAAISFGAAATAWDLVGADPAATMPRPHGRFRDMTTNALGANAFEAAYAAGRALSREQARRYALREDADSSDHEAGRSPLTARELEVAELVAQGMTNREIAGRLVIAPRTADTHVRHILTKLDFGKRAQIAAWMAGRVHR
ncbi:putative transcriptional regulator [Nocardia nova SH22a]|uniref:Putative transcriptional regulator n=1 Tax=Nocardia nova SH22a TaxID=1415166 RepID=W5TL11_9NOCA|nr:LuxR C-terminal-related transcriptional regulator [Nocardia nova]AHH19663.1 putative transcriptional regulator [Nocardia nova SH22a]